MKKYTGIGELGFVLEDGNFRDPKMPKCSLVLHEEVAESESIGGPWRQSVSIP
jgi:hypothetical protein